MAYIFCTSFALKHITNFEFLDGNLKLVRPPNIKELHEAYLANPEGRSFVGEPIETGYPVTAEHVPTRMILRTKRKSLNCCWPAKGFWAVCGEFKALVEELEPDVHQFFPFTLLSPKEEVVGERYLFVVCKRLDTIYPEKCIDLSETKDEQSGSLIAYGSIRSKKVVVHREAVEGHHLWWDKYLVTGFMISDQFYKELDKRKLRGMELVRAFEE